MLRKLLVVGGFACVSCTPQSGPGPEEPGPAVAGAPVVASAPGTDAPAVAEARVDTTLIPRAVLFGNPDREAPALSPDGKQLLYLAPVQGVMNVWVGPADQPEAAKPVTQDTLRGIRFAQ